MDKLYQDNQAMIKDMAWKVSKSTGLDIEDLESEGNLIFAKCLQNWNGKKSNGAKFSTYLYKTLTMDLYRYARKQAKENHTIDFEDLNTVSELERDAIAKVTLENLSRDARICIDLALNPPVEMMKLNKHFKRGKERLNKTLIKNYLALKGWKEYQIDKAFSEVRMAIM